MKRLGIYLLAFVLSFTLVFALASCNTAEEPSNNDGNNNNQNVSDIVEDNNGPLHVHEFDQKVIDVKYLKKAATCYNRTVYAYSCACGAVGTDTFEYGTPAHTYSSTSNYCMNCSDQYLKYEAESDGSYTVTGAYSDYVTIVDIPATYNNKPVKKIEKDAFKGLKYLESVSVGSNVQTIEEGAFLGCKALTTVIFSNSLDRVYPNAFYGCESIEHVYVSSVNDWLNIAFDSVTSNPLHASAYLYEKTLVSTTLITDVTIKGIKKIPDYAFYGCKSILNLEIGGSVEEIGNSAFTNCIALDLVDVYPSVVKFGYKAFEGCDNIQKVNIHDLSAWCGTTFGDSASNPIFYATKLYLDDVAITDLVIPEDVETIHSFAFYGCNSIITLTVPGTITEINASAFHGCANLVEVTLEEGVHEIGNSAFSNCAHLVALNLPSTLSGIGYDAFLNCESLEEINTPDISSWCAIVFDNAEANPITYAHSLTVDGTLLQELVIPRDVASINSYAFYNCESITTVTIGENVQCIGEYAFANCSSVVYLTYNAIAVEDLGVNNYTFYNFGASGGFTLYIGDEVTNIPNYLFAPNEDGEGAPTVTNIDFNSTSACTDIGDYAFSHCAMLKTVTLPGSLEEIGDHAFYKCRALANLTFRSSDSAKTTIGDYAFAHCESLNTLTLSSAILAVGNFAFTECTSLTRVTLGSGVRSIGYKAFYGCVNLKSVYNNSVLVLTNWSEDNGYITYYFDKK